ncbi:DUF6395 domain-containing protein [Serpentinicella alkaliphila]|uniref:7-cyano-7-deazaguanine synthase in queuosine biosynthesis n=1 Tax=Serpentinicella alkaliphila TaxID=1734049 RepID=A0A4R2TL71_9FIRM|nr:DUF6395 domain-containing protein [Serpentinicella alkaliphila]QUH27035.1 hypothetical protein HZR23_15785 [Serpentinicella alkaliphila]TCP95622.1 hypothetical protein EDD79_10586 [Serpentinicella alkaliphila]
MKVDFNCNSGVLNLKFLLDQNEGMDCTGSVKMERDECKIVLPKDWTVYSIHPDLFALAVILIVYPFIDKELNIGIGVSKEFNEEFHSLTGKKIIPVDNRLKPRKAERNSRPALAYSGGVDSTVALTLLPENTFCVFLDRILPKDDSNIKIYDKRAIYKACKFLSDIGRDVHVIETDLEYVRSPKGFAIEYSTSIPAILLADYKDGFDSIASGTVLESAYLEFKDFNKSRLYNIEWRKLFNIVDLLRNDVTAGLSNVATLKILHKDQRYVHIAKSCMKSDGLKNCMDCWKCFRKTLIIKTLNKEQITDELIDRLFLISEARTYLKRIPLRFENQFAYITANYEGSHPLMKLLKNLTKEYNNIEVYWLEKWYSPSVEHLCPKYKNTIIENIKKYVEVMSEEEQKIVQNWDSRNIYNLDNYKKTHSRFLDTLNNHRKNKKK